MEGEGAVDDEEGGGGATGGVAASRGVLCSEEMWLAGWEDVSGSGKGVSLKDGEEAGREGVVS